MKARLLLFTCVSIISSFSPIASTAGALNDRAGNTPIYLLDGSSYVITVLSAETLNRALSRFSGYKDTTAADRLRLRNTLRTSFVEGESGPQTNQTAAAKTEAGKAVCTLSFKDGSSKDSEDYLTTKNEALILESAEQQTLGFDGAIYLKDHYFYIYCQAKDRSLTVDYFNKAFSGVLKLVPLPSN